MPQAPGPAVGLRVIGTTVLGEAVRRAGFDDDGPDATRLRGQLVDERARALGEAIATIADVLNPDAIARDAFADHPRGLAPVQAAFDAARHLPHRLELDADTIRPRRAGGRRGGRRSVGHLRRPDRVAGGVVTHDTPQRRGADPSHNSSGMLKLIFLSRWRVGRANHFELVEPT